MSHSPVNASSLASAICLLPFLSPFSNFIFPSSCSNAYGNPLQCSCLENPMDGGAWWAAVHGVVKSWTRLSDFTFTFHFHALEKEMATRSSVLAWRIPGTGEPRELPSLGSHRVGHDWSDLAAAAAAAMPSASFPAEPPFRDLVLFPVSLSFTLSLSWPPTSFLTRSPSHSQLSTFIRNEDTPRKELCNLTLLRWLHSHSL